MARPPALLNFFLFSQQDRTLQQKTEKYSLLVYEAVNNLKPVAKIGSLGNNDGDFYENVT